MSFVSVMLVGSSMTYIFPYSINAWQSVVQGIFGLADQRSDMQKCVFRSIHVYLFMLTKSQGFLVLEIRNFF